MFRFQTRKASDAKQRWPYWISSSLIASAESCAPRHCPASDRTRQHRDTLEIHRTGIRLWGIDAPESPQLCRGDDSLQYRCGAKAANDLAAFIGRRPVSCIPISLDQYGRAGASCSLARADVAEWLVRSDLALNRPQYSKGKYAAAQRDAEHAGRGIWAGSLC